MTIDITSDDGSTIRCTKVDGPDYPKASTKSYFLDASGLFRVNDSIVSSTQFGKLDEGFLGQHPIELDHMGYGASLARLNPLYDWRTVRDSKREPLSQGYFFTQGSKPLSLFLLVRRPYGQLIGRHKDRYSVKAFARSSEKLITEPAKETLQNILEEFRAE